MRINPTTDPHQTTPTHFSSLFGGAKLVLEETPKAITPFGGLASFIAFLGQSGYVEQLELALPFPAPTSNNAIALTHTFTAFMTSVITGARRFAHTQWLRADHALHAMLGMERFPGDDTIRNFFLRFSTGACAGLLVSALEMVARKSWPCLRQDCISTWTQRFCNARAGRKGLPRVTTRAGRGVKAIIRC